jgi:hypothetical protein
MGNEVIMDKIDRTRDEVAGSGLASEVKDSLGNILAAARVAANGTTDKIGAVANLIVELALLDVRATVRLPKAIDDAVSKHQTTCIFAGPSGWRGIIVQCRWPIGIVLFGIVISPNFAAIAELIKSFARGG